MRFGSDNTSGVCPEVIEAIASEAGSFGGSYGADDLSVRLTRLVADMFEHDLAVFCVPTGTTANAVSLAALTPPYGSIACTSVAHVVNDECGAVEFYSGGARLVALAHDAGRLRPETLETEVGNLRDGVHSMPLSALTLTQQTELGTAYSAEELRELGQVAASADLRVHMDGARLANALVALGESPADITWRTGVDVLSLGATKNGAMGADAVVVFDADLAEEIAFRQKRAGSLMSKQRFLAAQLMAYFDGDLWLRNAAHANEMGALVASAFRDCAIAEVSLLVEPSGNEVFVRLPSGVVAALRDAGVEFHPFQIDGVISFRFVASWSTTLSEVDELRGLLASVGSTLATS